MAWLVLNKAFSASLSGWDYRYGYQRHEPLPSPSGSAFTQNFSSIPQDRFLPIANVARIMKKSIPSAQGKIAKDARECVQECVSEFISFITSEASDRCQVSTDVGRYLGGVATSTPFHKCLSFQAEKRKTINGEDILFAMSTLGFDNYVEPLKLYLQKYRESIKGDKQQGDDFEGMTDEAFGESFTRGKSARMSFQCVLFETRTIFPVFQARTCKATSRR